MSSTAIVLLVAGYLGIVLVTMGLLTAAGRADDAAGRMRDEPYEDQPVTEAVEPSTLRGTGPRFVADLDRRRRAREPAHAGRRDPPPHV